MLADYDFLFDLADQLVSSTHHGQTTTYTHDDAGQLTAADHSVQSDESYSYDPNGNRNSSGYVTGPNNQVLSDGTFDYAYDAEGNLLTKTEIATGEITAYTYDHRNRLVAVRRFDSTGEDLLHEVIFTYDVFDRRIAKSVDPDGDGAQPAETMYFVYDGHHVWADYDSSGVALAHYLFGDRIDELLARFEATNGTAWYLTDNLGTVRDLVDDAGDLLNHIDYDSFGRIIAQSNASAGDRFTYTGREWDAEIGLYYYRARFYDPGLGRFVSQDPIGFAAGDANLYRYVFNSPLTATDPLGLVTATEYGKVGQSTAQATEEAGPLGIFMRCVFQEAAEGMVFQIVVGGPVAPVGIVDAATTMIQCALSTAGLGANPFKGKSPQEIADMLVKRGYVPKGPNPVAGKGTFLNPKTGRSVHIDANHPPPKPPHVGVHRPRDHRNLPPREYPL